MTKEEVFKAAFAAGLRVVDRDGESWMIELVPLMSWDKSPFTQLAGKQMIVNPSHELGTDIKTVELQRSYVIIPTSDDVRGVQMYWYAPAFTEEEEGA